MHLQSGTLLQGGKYRIEKVLGQGGFGITYLAEQVMLQGKVAVKEFFFKSFCERDASTNHVIVTTNSNIELVNRFKQKFIKEARTLFTLNHHNIVPVFDLFEENGTVYYVMENLDGGCLDDLVKYGPMSEGNALKFIREIGSALDYIHDKNILHLDVKPSNILLRNNEEAVLIDFGISKHYDTEGGQTSTTPTGISKGYAPMEQYNQGVSLFVPSTDVYSLAATLYKLVTGQTPPEASIVNEEGLPEKPVHIRNEVWEAIVQGMQPKKKDRPESVKEFLAYFASEEYDSKGEDTVVEVEVESTEYVSEKPEGEFNVNGVEFKMVKVEGGTFDMKETVDSGFLGLSSKEIVQRTTLSDYWIAETVVTQELWQAVMGSNPSYFKGDNLPVEQVSWNDCQDFIKKLNSLTGKTFRLPTEAEWEYAARGGKKSLGYEYSGSNNINDVAWYDGNSGSKIHPVRTKQPNELGLYDMSGNVWEWCQDWKGGYSSSSQTNPIGPNSGTYRVDRGGSWGGSAKRCRSSYRDGDNPDLRSYILGFRLVSQ